MSYVIWRALVASAAMYVLLPSEVAEAGWIQDGVNWYNRHRQQPDYYVQPDADRPLNPIDRGGYGYVHQLGGGVDAQGNYNRPVPSRDAFGTDLSDGDYEAPANWDENLGIRYRVRNGQITGEQYQFYPRRRH